MPGHVFVETTLACIADRQAALDQLEAACNRGDDAEIVNLAKGLFAGRLIGGGIPKGKPPAKETTCQAKRAS